jgi:phosphoglucosamine mutase
LARKLFGTDGVRGVAGELLTAELALALGRAVTMQAAADAPRVLVIRDTRESGEMLEAALGAGVTAAGGDVLLAGVLPTPAAPLLLRRYGLDLAAVISASHNPYRDNGIKFFAADGFKLSDEDELAIEARLEELGGGGGAGAAGGGGGAAGGDGATAARPARIGRVRALHGTQEDYLRALHERFADLDLSGLDVVLDCAHGATYRAAPEMFRRLGATVTALNETPDGRNINDGCGSTHVDQIARAVVDGGHDVGFAFDGDGDRVLAVDRNGVVVDGDELIALATLHLREAGRLPGDGVAVTVMTNYGFHAAMREAGVEVATTAVGDRYVLEALRERGWALGGEQSGHIIDMGFNATGDGIASALLTLEALRGGDLAERDAMHKLPQKLVNVPVADRDAAMASPELAEAGEREAQALEGRGRVLVRPSGTEQLVRVMVEAPSAEEADAVCERLVALVSELSA